MSSTPGSRRIERLWYGGFPLAALLQPVAWMFGVIVGARRWAYHRRWFRTHKIAAPVIVIGNITVGGTGKTPFVAWLVRRLQAEGYRPGIVSRGYGVTTRPEPTRVTADSGVDQVGDEPLLLWRQTGVPVAVCTDRPAAANTLVASGCNVIVADDGLQHYAMARDLEIVVLDGLRRLGNGRLLPAGPLREPASRLQTAGLVMINGGEPRQGELRFDLRAAGAIELNGTGRCDLAAFGRQPVLAVAGIGNPQRFCELLRQHGMDPVMVAVPDHGRVDLEQLRCGCDGPILMTEKDAVKYPDARMPDVWYVPVEVEMPPEIERAVMSHVHDVLRKHHGSA